MPFKTEDGTAVPAVTAAQMREVDRIAVEVFGLTLLQMMENAGRNLAMNVLDMLAGAVVDVVVLAGAGGCAEGTSGERAVTCHLNPDPLDPFRARYRMGT